MAMTGALARWNWEESPRFWGIITPAICIPWVVQPNPRMNGRMRRRPRLRPLVGLLAYPMSTSTDLFRRAVAELEAGRPALAEQPLRQILQGEPTDARALLTLGQVLRLQGRSAEAVAVYQQLLQSQPGQPDALYQWATTLKDQGQLDQAIKLFRQLLDRQPDHADGLTGLGALLAARGQLVAAMPLLERAVQVRPDFAQARHNLGVGWGLSGRPDLARAELEESLRLRPDYPDAWANLGNILGVLGLRNEVEASYRRALELRPDHAGALTNLGLLLQKDDQASEAVTLLRRVVELRPGAPEAYNNLGLALLEARRAAEAVVIFRQAVRLNPHYGEASNNLAKALFHLGRLREAEASFLDALREQPQNAELHANLGTLLQSTARHDEALACFDLALMFDPECTTAHYNRSMSLLSQGKWLEGWADYEYRWGLSGQVKRQYRQPRWDGAPLGSRTILVWAEQGLGDMIHFVRYAQVLKEQGARVVLECPPHVVPLFRSVAGIDQIITEGDLVPAYDVQAPLLSLPGLLRTTPQSVPAEVPYLRAPAERIEHWRRALGSEPLYRIGISWRGSARHAHDHWRSVPLERFAPLAAVPGVSLVSLQKGPGSEEVAALGGRFAVWQTSDDEPSDSAEALLNTAALMSCLDLVVSVDTAVAHLAGALALPVWLAVSALPDWRWLRRGRETAWYPTMRLYRQQKLSKWRKVFARMARDLRKRVEPVR